MTRPLLVSDDAVLVDEVLRLAAASDVEVHLAADAESARAHWSLAPLVIVGADQAARVAGMRPERRRDVVLLGRHLTDVDWQRAVTLGAEHVAALPDAERWLIDRLADTGDGPARHGLVLAVMSAGGGAGASTLAATLAAAAAQDRRVLLVDLDPLAGGMDVLVGIEDVTSTRWDDLADTRGRLSIATLTASLPQWAGVCLVSWGRDGVERVTPDPLSAVLDAGERGFDLVVVDLPRTLDEQTELVLGRARRVLLVTAATVRGVAAASRIAPLLRERSASVGLVVRAVPRGVSVSAVSASSQTPVLGDVPFSAAVAARCDAGEGPSLSDAYGRAVRRLLPAALEGLAP